MEHECDLVLKLREIDAGRFGKLLRALEVTEECGRCDHFNLSVNDPDKGYRCYCESSCIAATLSPRLISYLNWKLGWITQGKHLCGAESEEHLPDHEAREGESAMEDTAWHRIAWGNGVFCDLPYMNGLVKDLMTMGFTKNFALEVAAFFDRANEKYVVKLCKGLMEAWMSSMSMQIVLHFHPTWETVDGSKFSSFVAAVKHDAQMEKYDTTLRAMTKLSGGFPESVAANLLKPGILERMMQMRDDVLKEDECSQKEE